MVSRWLSGNSIYKGWRKEPNEKDGRLNRSPERGADLQIRKVCSRLEQQISPKYRGKGERNLVYGMVVIP
jgi:hypothetical protein